MDTFHPTQPGTHYDKSGQKPEINLVSEKLRNIYWAEQSLLQLLPRLAKAASSRELTSTYDLHAAQSEEHAVKIRRIFYLIGERPQQGMSDVMAKLMEEYFGLLINPDENARSRDFKLIEVSLKVAQYFTGTYGALVDSLQTWGLPEVTCLLQSMLEQEKTRYQVLLHLPKFYRKEK